MLGQQRADEVRVVEGRDQPVAHGLGNAGAVGHGLGKLTSRVGARLICASARHAVIAALEFHDLVAPGEGAGEAHGVHVGLAAGRDVAHLLGAGHGAADFLGQFDAGRVVGEEGHAFRQLLEDGLQHFGMAVAEQHRAGADQVVDIFVAVLVPDPRARPSRMTTRGRNCRSRRRAAPRGRGRSSRSGWTCMVMAPQSKTAAGAPSAVSSGRRRGRGRRAARCGRRCAPAHPGSSLGRDIARQVADVEHDPGSVAAPRCSAAAVTMSEPQVPRCTSSRPDAGRGRARGARAQPAEFRQS
jgi:hypothetical protein